MRRWMMLAIAATACAAAHAQSAAPASDSWQRPAASSSTAYASSPATVAHDGQSPFRFKSDDKTAPSRFSVQGSNQQRKPGQAQSFCDAGNAACQQSRTHPGQGG